MEQNMEPHHIPQSPRRDLEYNLREEFGKVLHENRLDNLVNPSEIGFFPFMDGFASPTCPEKSMISGSPALHFPLSFVDHRPNGFSSSNRPINMAHSPARSNVSSTSDLHAFGAGSNSMFLSPNLPSKSFHNNTLGSNLKNLTDLDDNDIALPGHEESLSLMWTESPYPRPVRDENQCPTPNPKTLRNLNMEYDDSEADPFSNFTPFEDRRPLSMVSQMDRMYARAQEAENPTHSMSGNPSQETLDTRPDANSNSIRPFPSKKVEYLDHNQNSMSMSMSMSMNYDYSNDYDLRNDPRAKNIRGLRALSLQVKAHVAMVGETTYKDVAENLTKEVNDRLAADPSSEQKGDEQNVKRRVYDALNVLIATGVLRKEGKKVFCNPTAELVGIPKRRELNYQKERKTKQNEEKKRRIQQKLTVLREMVLKYLAIENLIERNKATEAHNQEGEEEEDDVDSDNNTEASCTTTIKELGVKTPQALNKSSALHFPFLVVKGSSTPSVMNLFMNNSRKMASIQSKSQLNIFGDTDVLLKLKLHYVSKELFNKVLPTEVHKFIPAAYMDELK